MSNTINPSVPAFAPAGLGYQVAGGLDLPVFRPRFVSVQQVVFRRIVWWCSGLAKRDGGKGNHEIHIGPVQLPPSDLTLVISERVSLKSGCGAYLLYATEHCQMSQLYTAGDFTPKPHNHRQDLTFTLLFRKAGHHLLKFGHGEDTAYCYRFKSALLEETLP